MRYAQSMLRLACNVCTRKDLCLGLDYAAGLNVCKCIPVSLSTRQLIRLPRVLKGTYRHLDSTIVASSSLILLDGKTDEDARQLRATFGIDDLPPAGSPSHRRRKRARPTNLPSNPPSRSSVCYSRINLSPRVRCAASVDAVSRGYPPRCSRYRARL